MKSKTLLILIVLFFYLFPSSVFAFESSKIEKVIVTCPKNTTLKETYLKCTTELQFTTGTSPNYRVPRLYYSWMAVTKNKGKVWSIYNYGDYAKIIVDKKSPNDILDVSVRAISYNTKKPVGEAGKTSIDIIADKLLLIEQMSCGSDIYYEGQTNRCSFLGRFSSGARRWLKHSEIKLSTNSPLLEVKPKLTLKTKTPIEKQQYVTITAESLDGTVKKSKTVKLSAPLPNSLILYGSKGSYFDGTDGDFRIYLGYPYPHHGKNKYLDSDDKDESIKIESENPNILSVDGLHYKVGKVEKNQYVYVKATYIKNGQSVSVRQSIYVKNDSYRYLSVICPSTVVNLETQCTATVHYHSGKKADVTSRVNWSSTYGKISPEGKYRSQNLASRQRVAASLTGVRAAYTYVIVKNRTPTSLSIECPDSLKGGDSLPDKCSAYVVYDNGTKDTYKGMKLSIFSSDIKTIPYVSQAIEATVKAFARIEVSRKKWKNFSGEVKVVIQSNLEDKPNDVPIITVLNPGEIRDIGVFKHKETKNFLVHIPHKDAKVGVMGTINGKSTGLMHFSTGNKNYSDYRYKYHKIINGSKEGGEYAAISITPREWVNLRKPLLVTVVDFNDPKKDVIPYSSVGSLEAVTLNRSLSVTATPGTGGFFDTYKSYELNIQTPGMYWGGSNQKEIDNDPVVLAGSDIKGIGINRSYRHNISGESDFDFAPACHTGVVRDGNNRIDNYQTGVLCAKKIDLINSYRFVAKDDVSMSNTYDEDQMIFELAEDTDLKLELLGSGRAYCQIYNTESSEKEKSFSIRYAQNNECDALYHLKKGTYLLAVTPYNTDKDYYDSGYKLEIERRYDYYDSKRWQDHITSKIHKRYEVGEFASVAVSAPSETQTSSTPNNDPTPIYSSIEAPPVSGVLASSSPTFTNGISDSYSPFTCSGECGTGGIYGPLPENYTSCKESECNGKYAIRTECSSDEFLVNSKPLSNSPKAKLNLWFSPSCGTNWVTLETNKLSYSDIQAVIKNKSGRKYINKGGNRDLYYYDSEFVGTRIIPSPMVYAPYSCSSKGFGYIDTPAISSDIYESNKCSTDFYKQPKDKKISYFTIFDRVSNSFVYVQDSDPSYKEIEQKISHYQNTYIGENKPIPSFYIDDLYAAIPDGRLITIPTLTTDDESLIHTNNLSSFLHSDYIRDMPHILKMYLYGNKSFWDDSAVSNTQYNSFSSWKHYGSDAVTNYIFNFELDIKKTLEMKAIVIALFLGENTSSLLGQSYIQAFHQSPIIPKTVLTSLDAITANAAEATNAYNSGKITIYTLSYVLSIETGKAVITVLPLHMVYSEGLELINFNDDVAFIINKIIGNSATAQEAMKAISDSEERWALFKENNYEDALLIESTLSIKDLFIKLKTPKRRFDTEKTHYNGLGSIGNRLPPHNKKVSVKEANKVYTDKDKKAPYDERFPAYDLTSTGKTKFVRFFNPDAKKDASNQEGKWMAYPEDVKGLTAKQIAEKLGLPNIPTKMVYITPPEGWIIRTGKVEANYNKKGGGIQFESIHGKNGEKYIPEELYSEHSSFKIIP